MSTKALANGTKFRWARETRPARDGYLWRNPVLIAGLAAAVVLLVAGFWIHHATEQAMRDKLREGLDTVAATSAAALLFWAENELSNADSWAELPEVRVAAQRLAAVAANSPNPVKDLLASPAHAELLASLQHLADSENYDSFGLVSRDGVVLAASLEQQVGLSLTADGVAELASVLRGQELKKKKGVVVIPIILSACG